MASDSGENLAGVSSLSVEKMAARLEIEDVLKNFTLGLDDADESRWLAAFHEDAVMVMDAGKSIVTGHAQLLERAKDMWGMGIGHHAGNHHIEVLDDTHATGVGRGLAFFHLNNGSFAMTTARTEDRFLKRDGAWRLAHRTVDILSSLTIDPAAFPGLVDRTI